MNYLYNGVGPLPDIYSVYTPELQVQFPHAYVASHTGNDKYYLLLDDTPKTTLAPMWSDAAFEETSGQWVEGASTSSLSYRIIWCNTDIRGEDGTLYLAASDPVPVSTYTPNPAAMLMGFQLGTAIRRMRWTKQPAMFLYNGIELPELPERVKQDTPYAYVVTLTDSYGIDGYVLLLSSSPTIGYGSNPSIYFDANDTVVIYAANNGKWEERGYGTALPDRDIWIWINRLYWANNDVYWHPNLANAGKLVLSASDPVPVSA